MSLDGALGTAVVIGVRAMRCMACGAEMILTNVVEDNTMAVTGFEHRTFVCSECQDMEQPWCSRNRVARAILSLWPSRRRHPSSLHQPCMMKMLLLQVS
jgi:hypothetical protein